MVCAQEELDVQIGCFDFYQPSFVWYARVRCNRLSHPIKAVDLLHSPKQSYLVLSAEQWEAVRVLRWRDRRGSSDGTGTSWPPRRLWW